MRERLLEVRVRTALQQAVEVDAKPFDTGQLRRQAVDCLTPMRIRQSRQRQGSVQPRQVARGAHKSSV